MGDGLQVQQQPPIQIGEGGGRADRGMLHVCSTSSYLESESVFARSLIILPRVSDGRIYGGETVRGAYRWRGRKGLT